MFEFFYTFLCGIALVLLFLSIYDYSFSQKNFAVIPLTVSIVLFLYLAFVTFHVQVAAGNSTMSGFYDSLETISVSGMWVMFAMLGFIELIVIVLDFQHTKEKENYGLAEEPGERMKADDTQGIWK
jgi:hypothetical protein